MKLAFELSSVGYIYRYSYIYNSASPRPSLALVFEKCPAPLHRSLIHTLEKWVESPTLLKLLWSSKNGMYPGIVMLFVDKAISSRFRVADDGILTTKLHAAGARVFDNHQEKYRYVQTHVNHNTDCTAICW